MKGKIKMEKIPDNENKTSHKLNESAKAQIRKNTYNHNKGYRPSGGNTSECSIPPTHRFECKGRVVITYVI